MKNLLLVGLGGFSGAVLRYGVATFFMRTLPAARFPWATCVVNLIGCFLVGVIAAALERSSFYNSELRLLLIVGFLGGFTTFSAFGLETLHLLRSQHYGLAMFSVSTQLLGGLLAVYLGLRILR